MAGAPRADALAGACLLGDSRWNAGPTARRFRRSESKGSERNSAMSSHSSSPSYTVLIIDDHDELLEALRFALSALGPFRIETASDGAEGLARIYELRPHCVVIDVKMPGVDGLQLARTLRGDVETASIPFVILSALIQENDQ